MSKLEEIVKKNNAAIERMEAVINNVHSSVKECMYAQEVIRIYGSFNADLQSLTSSHREEIEAAYDAGETDTWYELQSGPGDPDRQHKNPSDYYEKTFGSETPERFKK